MAYIKVRLAETQNRLERKDTEENQQTKKRETGLPREGYERYLTLKGRNGKPIMEEL